MLRIAAQFLKIPYDGSQYPGAPNLKSLNEGANCQRFACEFIRYFGYEIADFRSSNLREDTSWTMRATRLQPLDLLLFNKDREAYGV